MRPFPSIGAQEGDVHTGVFDHVGLQRGYRLTTPATLPPRGERALVVWLHGCTQDAADFARGTRIDVHARREGVIALLPEQDPAAHPQRCWNWYVPAHQARESGELALLAAMVRAVAEEHGVDARRIHLAGISAGGATAANLAIRFSELFASVAVHSGIPAFGARDVTEAIGLMRTGPADLDALRARAQEALGASGRVAPLYVLHGVRDAVVSVKAGQALAAQWKALLAWRGASPDQLRVEWIEGLGHAWSGGDSSGTYTDPAARDVTPDILRFLLERPMPEGR